MFSEQNNQKIYKIGDFGVKTQVYNKYIDNYIYYRLYGFFVKSIEQYRINLKILQKDKITELIESYKFNITSDDFTYNDENININIVNYKNYLIYDKRTSLLILYVQERTHIIEKILSIKLVSMVLSLLLQHQIFCIHSSCVKFKDTGLLILGNSGSGKTSLTLSLVEKGATLTNDDATFIQYGKKFIAMKNTQLIGLTDSGIKKYFHYLFHDVSFVDDNKKYRIDLNQSNPKCFESFIEINKIIWIESHRREVPLLTDMKKMEMIKNICKNISVNKYLYYDIYLQMITELVMNCNSYVLYPSYNLDQTLQCLIDEF